MGRDSRTPRSKRARGPRVYRRNDGAVFWAYVDRTTRFSLDTTDEAEALRKLGEYLSKRSTGPARPGRGEATLERIGEAYCDAPHGWSKNTQHTTALRVTAFVEAMNDAGIIAASHITVEVLDAWRAERMALVSRATINRDEVVARSMLRWAVERGMCPSSPFEGRKLLREPKRRAAPLIPSPASVRRALVAMREIADELQAAPARKYIGPIKRGFSVDAMRGAALTAEAALLSGLRLDELRHLRSEHLSSAGVRVAPEDGAADEAWSTKGYRERLIPLAPAARQVVGEFIAWRASAKGGQGRTSAMAQTWLADKIREGCKRAGVEPFDPHDLRRTFATNCVRSGVPLTVVRDWLGHRDVQTTERYLGRYAEDALLTVPMAAEPPPEGCTQSCTQPCTQHPKKPANS